MKVKCFYFLVSRRKKEEKEERKKREKKKRKEEGRKDLTSDLLSSARIGKEVLTFSLISSLSLISFRLFQEKRKESEEERKKEREGKEEVGIKM